MFNKLSSDGIKLFRNISVSLVHIAGSLCQDIRYPIPTGTLEEENDRMLLREV